MTRGRRASQAANHASAERDRVREHVPRVADERERPEPQPARRASTHAKPRVSSSATSQPRLPYRSAGWGWLCRCRSTAPGAAAGQRELDLFEAMPPMSCTARAYSGSPAALPAVRGRCRVRASATSRASDTGEGSQRSSASSSSAASGRLQTSTMSQPASSAARARSTMPPATAAPSMLRSSLKMTPSKLQPLAQNLLQPHRRKSRRTRVHFGIDDMGRHDRRRVRCTTRRANGRRSARFDLCEAALVHGDFEV